MLRLSEGLGQAPQRATAMIQGLAQHASGWTPDPARALAMAQSEMGRIVSRQALTLAFADTYRLMAWLFLGALVIVPFCKPAPLNAPPPPDAH